MSTGQYGVTNFTSQTATQYKTQLDANSMALAASAGFQPYANPTPAMNIKVAKGSLNTSAGVVDQAVQTTGTITAPVTHGRIDRVVIDAGSGAISVVTGTESVSPVAPAIPSGKFRCAQIALAVGQTSIVNLNITDERVMMPGSSGGAAPDFLLLARGVV